MGNVVPQRPSEVQIVNRLRTILKTAWTAFASELLSFEKSKTRRRHSFAMPAMHRLKFFFDPGLGRLGELAIFRRTAARAYLLGPEQIDQIGRSQIILGVVRASVVLKMEAVWFGREI